MVKGVPKKDGSGGGMRLNKGRSGCSIEEQEEFGKGQNIPKEKMFKMEKIEW